MKVSKVVLIVVALHVLVIGGIFIFEGCSRAKAPAPDMAENESPVDQTAANAPALPTPRAVEVPTQVAAPAPAVAPTAQPATGTYIVKKGDSLWKVAKLQGVSVGDLARANNLSKTSTLKIGQRLQIPVAVRTETTTAAASVIPTVTSSDASAVASVTTTDTGGPTYTVKSGDSLWRIARQQNVTVAALKQANNLTSDTLKVGQRLILPAPSAVSASTPAPASVGSAASADWHEPGTYTENGQTIHVVDIGESPAIIAKKYSVKVDDLMKVNNITDAKRIWVGEKLIIPTAQAQPQSEPVAPTVAAAPIVSAKPPTTSN